MKFWKKFDEIKKENLKKFQKKVEEIFKNWRNIEKTCEKKIDEILKKLDELKKNNLTKLKNIWLN